MADLQLTLLDTTLLQYCIFLGFAFSFAYFSVFFAFFLRFVFVIALYGDEKVNVILSHKICAESKIFLLF